jgi:ribosomal protein S18 acetylase RimI-like enzyme
MEQKEFIFEELTTVNLEEADAIRALTKQLGNNYKELTVGDYEEMITSSCNHLFVVREKVSNQIVGMVTVLIYRIPYAKKAYFDDFVIDEGFRKHGLGTNLFNHAIEFAKNQKVAYIDFTSSDKREAGNALYKKLGFQQRETNVYRLNFSYEEN